jgi:TatD DNase family protein
LVIFAKEKAGMNLIDTHAHIYLDAFHEDLKEVLNRAMESGIEKIVMPNIDASTLLPMHDTANSNPHLCIPLLGLHPTHVGENFREQLEQIFQEFNKYPYIGIGEIGIDLYWDKTFINEQISAFEYQLQMARKRDLPVVIHARNSFEEILDIVSRDEYRGLTGVFHAFTGDKNQAQRITDLGYLLGIGGILTFKNSNLSDIVKDISIEHLLLETDSPYLAPVPYRGKRNECSYLKYIAEQLAHIKNMTVKEVAELTTGNAKRLFRI